MYTPARDDEITGLVRYLEQQLDAFARRCRRVDGASRSARVRVAAHCRSAGCSSTSRTGCVVRWSTSPMARRRPSTRPDTRGTWRASPSPTTLWRRRARRLRRGPRSVPFGIRSSRSVGVDNRAAEPVVRHLRRGQPRTAGTTSCTRSRRWLAMPGTQTSSTNRSTGWPSRPSCSARRAPQPTTSSSRTSLRPAPSALASNRTSTNFAAPATVLCDPAVRRATGAWPRAMAFTRGRHCSAPRPPDMPSRGRARRSCTSRPAGSKKSGTTSICSRSTPSSA